MAQAAQWRQEVHCHWFENLKLKVDLPQLRVVSQTLNEMSDRDEGLESMISTFAFLYTKKSINFNKTRRETRRETRSFKVTVLPLSVLDCNDYFLKIFLEMNDEAMKPL